MYVVLIRYDSAQGLCTSSAVRLSLSRDHSYYFLDEFEGLFLLCSYLAGGQNDNNKYYFCDKSDAEILNSLKDWALSFLFDLLVSEKDCCLWRSSTCGMFIQQTETA